MLAQLQCSIHQSVFFFFHPRKKARAPCQAQKPTNALKEQRQSANTSKTQLFNYLSPHLWKLRVKYVEVFHEYLKLFFDCFLVLGDDEKEERAREIEMEKKYRTRNNCE